MSTSAAPVSPWSVDVRWRDVRRLLAVRLDNLGDVLMTTPALAALRALLPAARLTLLASPAGAALAPHLPMVDEAIAYEAPWMKRAGRGAEAVGVDADHRMLDRLAAGGFDAAVVFTVCTQSALPAALMCRLAGIPLRLAHARENPYDLLTDWVRDADLPRLGVRHEVRRQLDLVATLGARPEGEGLVLRHGAADRERAGAQLRAAGLPPGAPYVVIHPGATAPSRRWPDARWGRVAERLHAATGVCPVFVGGAGEAGAVAEALQAMDAPARAQALALVDALSLGEFAALVAGAELLLCNNSAPSHIAAAVGTPVVVLYALTNPQHTPWAVPARVLSHDVPCRDCLQSVCPQPRRACLDDVDVDRVLAAALELGFTPPVAARPAASMESA